MFAHKQSRSHQLQMQTCIVKIEQITMQSAYCIKKHNGS